MRVKIATKSPAFSIAGPEVTLIEEISDLVWGDASDDREPYSIEETIERLRGWILEEPEEDFGAESIDICDLCDNPSVWTDGNVHRCNPCYQQKGAPYQLQRNMRNVINAEEFGAETESGNQVFNSCWKCGSGQHLYQISRYPASPSEIAGIGKDPSTAVDDWELARRPHE